MSAARLTYLIIIPSLITLLLPLLGAAFPEVVTSPVALKYALFAGLVIVIGYAAGAAWLASQDHRRISARRISPTR
ncbi:hypothetical protein [Sphingomonas sp. BK580]|uniref:hypothetical protein n=1 Tax=Sphingomonas sp. BK580 TaxID=2586972 RepID=UPI0016179426|nr:hypothetical protein [Sphingomonas sp. BK580]MBB3695684.1 hypothetical protein [Sphingomonas sp. BK580]